MANESRITTDLEVDDRLVQTADYRFDRGQRQFIDNQIVGIQQHIVDGLISGRLATWFDLDSTSDVVVGDTVCLASTVDGKATKSTSSALANAKSALGVVLRAASKNAKVLVATGGIVPSTITELAASSPGDVRVNTTTGRCEFVSTLADSDYGLGTVDNAGNMHIVPGFTRGGGSSASGSNLGAGVAIFKDTSGATLRHRTIKTIGTSKLSAVENANDIELHPSPPGHYNACDFGAAADNVTDDTPALQALINAATASAGFGVTVYLPPGTYYCADNLYVTRTIVFCGAGPSLSRAIGANVTNLRFAAGKGLIVSPLYSGIGTGYEPYRGGYGTDSIIRDLFIESTQVAGITTRGATAILGALIKTPRNDDNRYFWECIKAGSTAVSAPDFRTCGNPYTGTVLPGTGATIHRGQQVHDTTVSTATFWECTATTTGIRGSTASSSLFAGHATAGNTVTDGGVTWTCRDATSYFLTDSGVVWACRTVPGVWVQTRCILENVYVTGFTNAGILIQPPLNANATRLLYPKVTGCGCGIIIRGGDASQCSIIHPYTEGIGLVGCWIGTSGGIGYWDGGFTGSHWYAPESQASSGRGFIMGAYNQDQWIDDVAHLLPSAFTVIGGYQEGGLQPFFNRGFVWGWNSTFPVNVDFSTVSVGIYGAQNIGAQDLTSAKSTYTYLSGVQGADRSIDIFNADNTTNTKAHTLSWYQPSFFNRTGWWWEVTQNKAVRGTSGFTAAEGKGWAWQPYGEFRGGVTANFANQYFCGYDPLVAHTHGLDVRSPGGANIYPTWASGDRFSVKWDGASAYAGWVYTSAGYGGFEAWTNGRAYTTSYSIEPTATFGYPSVSGGKVFKCIRAHTASGEPTWTGATVAGDKIQVGGLDTWELVGYVPDFKRIDFLDDLVTSKTLQSRSSWRDTAETDTTTAAPKDGVDGYRFSTTTSATTADQVLATIPLNNNTTNVVDVIIKGKLPSSTSGTVARISGSFTRSGATVTRLGTDDAPTPKDAGALAGSTFNLNISSTSIEVRATPGSASTTNWGITVQVDEVSN